MAAPLWFALACSIAAILYGIVSTQWILKQPTGNDRMREIAAAVQAGAKKNALSTAAIFPAIMLVCYLALILHFKSRGGYRSEELAKV